MPAGLLLAGEAGKAAAGCQQRDTIASFRSDRTRIWCTAASSAAAAAGMRFRDRAVTQRRTPGVVIVAREAVTASSQPIPDARDCLAKAISSRTVAIENPRSRNATVTSARRESEICYAPLLLTSPTYRQRKRRRWTKTHAIKGYPRDALLPLPGLTLLARCPPRSQKSTRRPARKHGSLDAKSPSIASPEETIAFWLFPIPISSRFLFCKHFCQRQFDEPFHSGRK